MKYLCGPFEVRVPLIALLGVVVFSGCDSSGGAIPLAPETLSSNPLFLQQYNKSAAYISDEQSPLVNGSFDQPLGGLPGWSACVDDSALVQYLDTSSVADISHVNVGQGECILQAMKVTPGDDHALSCFLSTQDREQWSGMAVTYYDDAGNFLAESDVATVDSFLFRRKAVTATAPANADVALAWFYTDAGGRIADCEFQTSSSEEPAGRHYRKTINVERQFSYNSNLGTVEGFAFTGYTELQTYPRYSSDKFLIDGFESNDSRRNMSIGLGVTEEHLHVVVSVPKHYSSFGGLGANPAALFTDSFPVAGDLWNDDSIEIYFNTGNEAGSGYDTNDFVRIYGYDRGVGYEPVTVTGINSQLNLTNEAVCHVEGGASRISCEVRFSLEELGIKGEPVAEIGFDVHLNADDDGGDRDAKYSWCGDHTVEAWRDMSVVDCSLRIIQ